MGTPCDISKQRLEGPACSFPFFFFFSFLFSFLCGCAVRTIKIYSLSNLRGYNTVLLTRVTILYISSPEPIHLITESLCPLTNISPFFPPPSSWQQSFYSVPMSSAFLDSTYECEIMHPLSFSAWLISFGIMTCCHKSHGVF